VSWTISIDSSPYGQNIDYDVLLTFYQVLKVLTTGRIVAPATVFSSGVIFSPASAWLFCGVRRQRNTFQEDATAKIIKRKV